MFDQTNPFEMVIVEMDVSMRQLYVVTSAQWTGHSNDIVACYENPFF